MSSPYEPIGFSRERAARAKREARHSWRDKWVNDKNVWEKERAKLIAAVATARERERHPICAGIAPAEILDQRVYTGYLALLDAALGVRARGEEAR